MNNIIMITINGTAFYFEDNSFTAEQKSLLQEVALSIKAKFNDNEHEILKRYLNAVKDKLGIDLNEIKISFVIRFYS
jgi:hypothetical protein